MTAATATRPRLLLSGKLPGRLDVRLLAPSLFVALNGVVFVLVKPSVNDLWAARARASAVENGVGLTYWFSWFGGGATPGNYSVLTPYLCAAIGTEMVGALSALVISLLIPLLVRDTRHPLPATVVGAVVVCCNLWNGRVPYLLGAAVGLGAVIALRRGHRTATVGLTLLSILASPVSGAFIGLGLSGTFLTTRTRAYRPIIAYAVISAGLALIAVAAAFGMPGPEPFSNGLFFEVMCGLLALWVSWPSDHVRTTLGVTLIAVVGVWLIPNGLGSNISRFVLSCLPVLVLATSTRRRFWAVAGVIPVVCMSLGTTAYDLFYASQPISSVAYYQGLVRELDHLPDLRDYRLEIVNHGAHAGDDALVGHALLARGWETQEDTALNAILTSPKLDAVSYKVWLDNNAVGYVALPNDSTDGLAEYALVQTGKASYLHRIWSSAQWQLFQVDDPTPIVARPASMVGNDQKSMTISVPCACTIGIRVRWSKFLVATRQDPDPEVRPVLGRLVDDGTGWTRLTTSEPGTYVLRGSLKGLLH
ncbi:MAG: hypothetical protein J0H43_13545 [Actinobacteria bacterium]|nr:hypothetical protein [Actinomycetota bacterium]